ncbi:MAG: hypothetical protein HZT43_06105 [Exiguobacterium profundum]|nr:MAG: hypothetical protein HZT43_06105 [Exiguobacterium profundum]
MLALSFPLILLSEEKKPADKRLSPLMTIILVVLGPLFAAVLAIGFVHGTIPMAHALVLGGPSKQVYTVDRALGENSRYCRNEIAIRRMPPLLDVICNLPREINTTLWPGKGIVVEGWGSSAGIFITQAHAKGAGD